MTKRWEVVQGKKQQISESDLPMRWRFLSYTPAETLQYLGTQRIHVHSLGGKKKKSNLCSFSCREKAYFCRSCFLVLCLLVLRNLGKLWGFSPMLVLVKYGLWVQKWWREAGMGRHSSGECSVSIGNQSKNMHVAAAQLCYYLKLLAKPVKQPLK